MLQKQKVECADLTWINKVTGAGCVKETITDDVDKNGLTAQAACCRFGGGTNCEGDVTLETIKARVNKEDAIVNYRCTSKNVNLFEGNGCAGKITKTYEKKSNFHYYQCEKYTIDCSNDKTITNEGLNPANSK